MTLLAPLPPRTDRTPIVFPTHTNISNAYVPFFSETSHANSAMVSIMEDSGLGDYFPTPVTCSQGWMRSALADLTEATLSRWAGRTGPCSLYINRGTISNAEIVRRSSNVDVSRFAPPLNALMAAKHEPAPRVQQQSSTTRPASSATAAVEGLKVWLQLTDAEVAELAGFSRRTLTNWRSGANSYTASSRKLFSLHAFVAHLITNLGVAGTRLWLALDDGTGRSRLLALYDNEDSTRNVMTLTEDLLFPLRRPEPEAEDIMHGYSEAEMSALIAGGPRGQMEDGGVPLRTRNPD